MTTHHTSGHTTPAMSTLATKLTALIDAAEAYQRGRVVTFHTARLERTLATTHPTVEDAPIRARVNALITAANAKPGPDRHRVLASAVRDTLT